MNHQSSNAIDVNNLNDDCLIHIFEFLSAKERLKIESVSRRWNRVSKLSWSQFRTFEVHKILPYDDKMTKKEKIILANMGINILERCSIYLNALSVCYSFDTETCLEFNRFFNELPKHCKNVTHLSIRSFNLFSDEYLKNLFNIAINLSSISLHDLTIQSYCFLNLRADNLKELKIEGCEFKSVEFFHEFLTNLNKLNKLEINSYQENLIKLGDAFLKSHCANIKECKFSFRILLIYEEKELPLNLFMFLSKQKNLKTFKLHIGLGIINEQMIKNIPTKYLEELDIQFFDDYNSDIFFKYIHTFENLKTFKFEFSELTDNYLEKITKLINKNIKTLYLKFCGNSSTDKPVSCFRRLQSLESFTIDNFYKESSHSLDLDMILEDLLECKNLKYLNILNDCTYSDSLLKQFYTLPNIVKVEIIVNDFYESLKKNC